MARKKREEDSRSEQERMMSFLEAYAQTFSVVRAAEAAEVAPSSHYRWYHKLPNYRAAFEKRKLLGGQWLETECLTRAGEGWLEPIYYQGAECGQVRRFDSGLAQFLLRGMLPQKYAARTEVSGPAGEPMQAKIEVVFVRPGEISGEE
jgi:hypothetical protein